MRTFSSWLLLLLCLALLSGCGKKEEHPTAPPEETVPAIATVPATEPAETTVPETALPTEAPTQPSQPNLSIEHVPVEDVLLYFNEVVLDAEYFDIGNPNLVQKWTVPIRYILYGAPTDEDLDTLNHFANWLNTIDGFPGIAKTDDPTAANLRIHFCDQEEMQTLMGEDYIGMDGAVTFWYENHEIYDAIICIRTDLDQHLRSSVILEELYNGLGPVQDTWLREDSIIYGGYSEPQALTPTDELLLKLLYHPDILCGMDAAECEEVIRQLYS